MWSSEEEFSSQTKRAIQTNLSFKYLTPSSFRVLRPENEVRLPNLSLPINPHKLTPTIKRKRNAAFSIIAESVSNPVTRSPSPTSGRVSPFRARGFNPTGSRHASPQPSPSFEKKKIGQSKIPKLTRYDSSTDADSSPSRIRNNFTRQLSQSLSNIAPRNLSYKPPPTPNTIGRHHRIHAIQKLSPIDGSSPEPSPSQRILRNQQKSSPSRIPRSRSQPPNKSSESRSSSRVNSRNVSRNVSREPSPNKFTSKFNYVKAKVNSFNAVKPKVPPKPQVPNSSGRNKRSANSGSETDEQISKIELVKDLISAPFNPEFRRIDSSHRLNCVSPATEAVVAGTTHTVTKPLKIEARIESMSDDSSREDHDRNEVYMPDARALSATSVSTALNRMNDTVLDTKTVMQDNSLKMHSSSASNRPPTTKSSTTVSSDDKKVQNNSNGAGVVTKGETGSSAAKVSSDAAKMTSEAAKVTNEAAKATNEAAKVTNGAPKATTETTKMTNETTKVTNEATTYAATKATNQTLTTGVKIEDSAVKSETIGRNNERNVIGLSVLPQSGDQTISEKTIVTKEVQPIRITVKEKPANGDLQSGNVRFQTNANGIGERPGLPPPEQPQQENTSNENQPKTFYGRFLQRFKRPPKNKETKEMEKPPKENKSTFLSCIKPKPQKQSDQDQQQKQHRDQEQDQDRVKSDENLIANDETQNLKWYQKMFRKGNKVSDTNTTGCFSKAQRKTSWADRADSIASEIPSSTSSSKNFIKKIFCGKLCTRRKKKTPVQLKRDASMMSKKKSLTPSITIEQPKPKLDAALIEHMSLMKGAIPVLSVPLAWFCLILNVFIPGFGTIMSGFLCLCTGKSRFSAEDGMKQRIGACLIDFFIGAGQFFTVLFCLVGWGWSIWWGVIMIKLARKYRKIRRVEKAMEEDIKLAAEAAFEDLERGS